MYATDTILTFGFPVGRLGGARFRISFLFPVTLMALMWRLESVEYGLLAGTVLLCSVLLHELAHLIVARSTGGEMDEIELWPLGGLEEPYGRGYWQDHLQTMLAGPAINLAIALTCLWTIPVAHALELLNPTVPFAIAHGELLAITVCRIVFLVNALLFAVNLIPITPFDSGVLLRTYLTSRFSEIEGRDLMVRLGLMLGLLGMLVGFVIDAAAIVAVSAVVLVLHMHENMRWYESPDSQDDFSEYDFAEAIDDEGDSFGSHGSYSATADDELASHAEILEQWRSQREEERLQQEREEKRQEEEQVDRILAKLHLHGRESLSKNDLHLLNQVSNRYRDRSRQR